MRVNFTTENTVVIFADWQDLLFFLEILLSWRLKKLAKQTTVTWRTITTNLGVDQITRDMMYQQHRLHGLEAIITHTYLWWRNNNVTPQAERKGVDQLVSMLSLVEQTEVAKEVKDWTGKLVQFSEHPVLGYRRILNRGFKSCLYI